MAGWSVRLWDAAVARGENLRAIKSIQDAAIKRDQQVNQ